jgi:adenylate cyclase
MWWSGLSRERSHAARRIPQASARAYVEAMGDGSRMTPEAIRAFMTGESPGFDRQRRIFRHVPSSPRCKLCAAPFRGLGAVVLKPAGYGRSPGNPALCMKCTIALRKQGLSGVEIPATLLFSDVRGSTALGERLTPSAFHTFLDYFYRLATQAIEAHDGIVDKIVGDEVIGLFFGGVSGPQHQAVAIRAAFDLAERAARQDATPSGPIPVGTAVHTGTAYVGGSGAAGVVEDFTALGDVVNATARLASAARAGEVLISAAAADAAGISGDGAERRTVEIRGRMAPLEVLVLRPTDVPR